MDHSHQAPLSIGFSRQEYLSGLPFLSAGDLPVPRIKPISPALASGFFTTVPPGKPHQTSTRRELRSQFGNHREDTGEPVWVRIGKVF